MNLLISMHEVTIYTDGACRGNPGPGGIGIVLLSTSRRKEISRGYERTTNNRMELLAVITAIQALTQRCRVRVFSDSKYIVRAVNDGWLQRWAGNGWRRNKTKEVSNRDLWETMFEILKEHEITFEWTKGHAADAENNRCDSLARMAACCKDLVEDSGYVAAQRPNEPQQNLF